MATLTLTLQSMLSTWTMLARQAVLTHGGRRAGGSAAVVLAPGVLRARASRVRHQQVQHS
eukprot:1664230-Rhodomonas_salina.2